MNILSTKKYVAVVVAGLVLPLVSCAASFDCGKAITTTEKMICKDEELSLLDEQLANVYKLALDSSPN